MEDEYELKVVKEGYKIYPNKDNKHYFKCEKLSYLKVKVEDLDGNPLSGVLYFYLLQKEVLEKIIIQIRKDFSLLWIYLVGNIIYNHF